MSLAFCPWFAFFKDMMAQSLRSNEHKIIGFPSPFPQHVLPTKGDVRKRMLLSRESLEQTLGKKIVPLPKIIQPVVEELVSLWEKSSIPTIVEKSIQRALTNLWEGSRRGLKNETQKRQVEVENDLLFDISACKCKQIPCAEAQCRLETCEDVHIDCKCESTKIVPKRELGFLFDQRGPRRMMMSGTDMKVTQQLQRSEKREAAAEARKEKEEKRLRIDAENKKRANEEFFAEDDEGNNIGDENSDKNWEPDQPSGAIPKPKTRNMQPLPKTGEACDRWGVSSEAAADIINTYLMELGTLTPENMSTMTVDKSKLNRWRKTGRKQLQQKEIAEMTSKPVTSIYFDGKKDSTLTNIQKGDKIYTKTIIEDHYVILEEPGSAYFGHEVPYTGHGISIGLKLFRFLKSKGCTGSISVVGADGCNVNVGNKEGAIVYLEKLLGRPLQWFICMLHGCELPFRALVRALDGGTSGPFTLKGPIGSTLDEDLTELDVIPFKKITNPDFPTLEELVIKDLSKDQAYLHRMCQAVMQGEVPSDLANQEPGPLSNARWVTLANRLLRKYISTRSPSRKFQSLIHAIINFYAPSWFQIKCHPRCTDGPKNLFKMVEFSKKLKEDLQEIAQKVLQRNAYFGHPEAILLAILADDDEEIRAQGINTILTIRLKANLQGQVSPNEEDDGRGVDEQDDDNEVDESDSEDAFTLEPSEKKSISSSNVRKFVIPKINFDATTYAELIDWESSKLTEPPLTLSLTEAELLAFKGTPFEVPHYPCHTQAVERGIRLVSQASSSVVGQEARDGFIRQRIQARKELNKFDTKRDFFAKVEAYEKK